jgi:hypothetical protein
MITHDKTLTPVTGCDVAELADSQIALAPVLLLRHTRSDLPLPS